MAKAKEPLALALTKLILSTSLIVSAGALIGAIGYLVSYPKIVSPIYVASNITASPSPTKVLSMENWQTYRNEDYGFEFKYPENIVKPVLGKNGVVLTQSILPTINDPCGYGQEEQYSVMAYFTYWDNNFLDKINKDKTGKKTIDIGAAKGYGFFSDDLQGCRTENRYLSLTDQKTLNISRIAYYAPSNDESVEKVKEIFDQILSTFKFVEKDENVKTSEIKAIPYEIIKDIADDNNSCQDKNIIAAEDYSFDFKTIDLNNDNAGEISIDAYNICDTNLMGATSDNHAIYIYQKINGVWVKILASAGSSIDVLGTKTNDYNDIGVEARFSNILISSSQTYYEWNKSKLSYEEISNIIESGIDDLKSEDNTIDNWNSYTDYRHNFEIKYPIGVFIDKYDKEKDSIELNNFDKSSDKASSMFINYISQDKLSTMGINYCDAYPTDRNRCESVNIDGKNYIIEKSADSESVMLNVGLNNGGLSITLKPVTAKEKNIFREIISTFKFLQ